MKKIEVLVVNKYNSNQVKETYEINYTEDRSNKIGKLEGCIKVGEDNNKATFIYKDNKMKGILLYRGLIKPYMTEDWINTFNN